MARKPTNRTRQYIAFAKKEGIRVKDIRKELRVSPKRYKELLQVKGKPPTKRQAQIMYNVARRVARKKASRLGFTGEELRKGLGKPILLLARARGMTKAMSKVKGMTKAEAAADIRARFDAFAHLSKAKKERAWNALRKELSPKRYAKLEAKKAKPKRRRRKRPKSTARRKRK